jgi:hypothetical protein
MAPTAETVLTAGTVRRLTGRRPRRYTNHVVGEWRSLVARLLREQEVAGSNPVSPTIFCFTDFLWA